MTADFVPYKDSLEIKKVEEEKVVFELEGFTTSTSDMDATDKNTTIEFELSRSKAQNIFKQLRQSQRSNLLERSDENEC